MKTTVVIVDDHASIREMLGMILAREGPYEVVGHAGTGFEALNACRKHRPRLAILDLLLPELNGVEVLRLLRAELPDTRLLIYSGAVRPEMVAEALRVRPHGFVHKTDSWAIFCDALRTVAGGGSYFTPFATRVMDDCRGLPIGSADLTARERIILQLIAEGMSSKEMADRLDLSAKTVEHHRANVMEKLNLHCVAQLTRYAVREGLVTAGE